MIYRLKADTKKAIEDEIPFELYRTDEDGSKIHIPATKEYSYHFIGKEYTTDPEYDSDGELITEAVLSDHVLADIRVYNGQEMDFTDVDVLNPETPMHGWT